jgi:hypothetical protein
LPRRGLAQVPDVAIACVEHPAGRLLVAVADGAPCAFFAWPAPTAEALRAGLSALLAAWTSSTPLHAAPALARLDTSGRLRPRSDAASAIALPLAASAASAALLAVVAGAPATLFAARLDALDGDDRDTFAARWFHRAALLHANTARLEIHLSDDERDLALRRAGLDRDPGWLAWLTRKLAFVFAPQSEGAVAADEEAPGDDA